MVDGLSISTGGVSVLCPYPRLSIDSTHEYPSPHD